MKNKIKYFIITLVIIVNVPNLIYGHAGNTDKLPVLLYHHLIPQEAIEIYGWEDNSAVISVEDFEDQMDYLYKNGFHTLTLQELENFIFNNVALPPRSVMIHFDDGYYSNWVYAMPILERYGFIAQQFLIGKTVYDRGDEQPEFSFKDLVFTAIKTIEGTEHVWETANHTFTTHHIVPNTDKTAFVYYDIEFVRSDILRCFDFVNNYTAFSYPRGQYNEEKIDLLQELGIKMAFTTYKGYVTEGSEPMLLPRFIIWPNTSISTFASIVNGDSIIKLTHYTHTTLKESRLF